MATVFRARQSLRSIDNHKLTSTPGPASACPSWHAQPRVGTRRASSRSSRALNRRRLVAHYIKRLYSSSPVPVRLDTRLCTRARETSRTIGFLKSLPTSANPFSTISNSSMRSARGFLRN